MITGLYLHRGDARLIYHAFKADRFSFDAGSYEPGADTRMTLAEPGDSVLQCGLHTTMKLTLSVEWDPGAGISRRDRNRDRG